VDPEVTNA
jgi:hypothetical protein